MLNSRGRKGHYLSLPSLLSTQWVKNKSKINFPSDNLSVLPVTVEASSSWESGCLSYLYHLNILVGFVASKQAQDSVPLHTSSTEEKKVLH